MKLVYSMGCDTMRCVALNECQMTLQITLIKANELDTVGSRDKIGYVIIVFRECQVEMLKTLTKIHLKIASNK